MRATYHSNWHVEYILYIGGVQTMERSLGVIGERVERLAAQAARLGVGASPERGRSITARAAQVQANFRELKVCSFFRRLHREISSCC